MPETAKKIDHDRGLCGKPDVPPNTPRFKARGKARCQCCNAPLMRDEDATSVSLQQLGCYALICPVCPTKEQA